MQQKTCMTSHTDNAFNKNVFKKEKLRVFKQGRVKTNMTRFALTAVCMLTGFTFCIPLKTKCAEDVIKAYIDHICCTFGPSRKILTDNVTEFKNKLWTEVFEKLKIEQKFTPIYSPQCHNSKTTRNLCQMG